MSYTRVLFTVLLIVPSLSFAQSGNQSSTPDLKTKATILGTSSQPRGKDADRVLTNRMLRASSGSKSKFSVKSYFIYNGSSLEKPLAQDRPNIKKSSGATTVSNLVGAVSGKYGLTSTDSFSLGIGLRWLTPLDGRTPKGYKKFDAADPYLNYQKIYQIWGIQSVFATGPTVYTTTNSRQAGNLGYWDFSQMSAKEIGRSKVSVGMNTTLTFVAFDKHDAASKAEQSDYGFGLYPFVEYAINDRYNLRTLSGLAVYEHERTEGRTLTMKKNVVYQSVGVGISVNRDVFLYPNVQFIPDDIRIDRTNLTLNATINVF